MNTGVQLTFDEWTGPPPPVQERRVLAATAELLERYGWKRQRDDGPGFTVLEAMDRAADELADVPLVAWDGALRLLAGAITPFARLLESPDLIVEEWAEQQSDALVVWLKLQQVVGA